MITISLCMIVKNEEDTLGRCLDSIKGLIDEVVIVDTGSTDRTKDIAKEYTDKIFDFEWIDDFSAARNYSFSKATMDYILWLDADDIFMEIDLEKLKELKETLDSDTDAVTIFPSLFFIVISSSDSEIICPHRKDLCVYSGAKGVRTIIFLA